MLAGMCRPLRLTLRYAYGWMLEADNKPLREDEIKQGPLKLFMSISQNCTLRYAASSAYETLKMCIGIVMTGLALSIEMAKRLLLFRKIRCN
jgi:hypothetical protein